MSPEVVRGDALPSTRTDLFSLAILLFYMLYVHHPLEGKRESEIKCFDLPAMTKLYGTDPVFIFDPKNRSNEPVPGYHDNAIAFWPIYPQFIRDRFTQVLPRGFGIRKMAECKIASGAGHGPPARCDLLLPLWGGEFL